MLTKLSIPEKAKYNLKGERRKKENHTRNAVKALRVHAGECP